MNRQKFLSNPNGERKEKSPAASEKPASKLKPQSKNKRTVASGKPNKTSNKVTKADNPYSKEERKIDHKEDKVGIEDLFTDTDSTTNDSFELLPEDLSKLEEIESGAPASRGCRHTCADKATCHHKCCKTGVMVGSVQQHIHSMSQSSTSEARIPKHISLYPRNEQPSQDISQFEFRARNVPVGSCSNPIQIYSDEDDNSQKKDSQFDISQNIEFLETKHTSDGSKPTPSNDAFEMISETDSEEDRNFAKLIAPYQRNQTEDMSSSKKQ